VVHKSLASRKKSRLTIRINKASAVASAAAAPQAAAPVPAAK